MRVLLTVPHVFSPKEGSLYSSQNEAKREVKVAALKACTLGNIGRHHEKHWIHASLGLGKPVVTRQLCTSMGVDLEIQVYCPPNENLTEHLEQNERLKINHVEIADNSHMGLFASRKCLEQADNYDIVGYMEDDLLIEDAEFFGKISALVENTREEYAFIPHRCESIPNKGDVILSGDPDGGRPDLFWDTGETIEVAWPLGARRFYRATNPHSGCYFLTSSQAQRALRYWVDNQWGSPFTLSGPLEQAASGMLLPVLKVMKPVPNDYRFLMVRHQDELWKRHHFEAIGGC